MFPRIASALALLLAGCVGTSDTQLKATDNDGDGYSSDVDCNDADAAIHPGAIEVCDPYGTDEDCNGVANDDDAAVTGSDTYFRDGDGDNYGGTDDVVEACVAPTGYTALSGDCDDADPAINPNATELCDPDDVDEDCNGLVDDQDAADPTTMSTFYADADDDGFGWDGLSTQACDLPPGYIDQGGDCDDSRADVNPDAMEVCDPDDVDEDCDGLADDFDDDAQYPNVFFTDADDDGYGVLSSPVYSCDRQPYTSDNALDCDDTQAGVNPGATEVCDPGDVDEDCNGAADDDDAAAEGKVSVYVDADGDGYGNPAYTASFCDVPGGYADNGDDCDDSSRSISPDGTEVCDSRDADEDCDGLVDDADGSVDRSTMTGFFRDADGDGWGSEVATSACDEPAGYTTIDGDCDDTVSSTNPGATEVCDDGVDNDCDGTATGCGWSGTYTTADADSYVYGATASDGFGDGNAFGAQGDVDGDGYDDIVVGSYAATGSAASSGAAYVFYGPTTGAIRADSADRTLKGVSANNYFGWATASRGDLDNDGKDDIVVGAPQVGSTYAGAAYVYTNSASSSASSTITASNASAWFGTAVVMGDYTGDGKDDLIVGAGGTGVVYEFTGSLTSASMTPSNAKSSFTETGAGMYLSMGDFDGDGVDDLVSGDPAETVSGLSSAGAVWLWDGGTTGAFTKTDCYAAFKGDEAGEELGTSVALDGDWNGDGYDDLLTSAWKYDGGVTDQGMFYAVYGPVSGSNVISAVGAGLYVGTPRLYFGTYVAYVGDVDQDGTDDVAVSAYGADYGVADVGVTYLLAAWDSTDVDATFYGTSAAAYSGWVLAAAGDNDGDGQDDFLISTPGASVSKTADGQVSLFLGEGM